MAPNGRQTGTILGRALVALALAVLALLPPGVMPARVGDAMTVVICTGDGPMTKSLPAAVWTATLSSASRCRNPLAARDL